METTLRDKTCFACKRPLLEPVAAAYPASSPQGQGLASTNSSRACAPVAYYFECDHWLHQHCVRNIYVHPAASVCGICITNTYGAGVSRGVLRRLQGLIESTKLRHAEGAISIGRMSAVDAGANLVTARRALSDAETTQVDMLKELDSIVKDAAKDEQAFENDFQHLWKCIVENGVVAEEDLANVCALREDKRQHALLQQFFGESGQTLFEYMNNGGSLALLIRLGATWQELCRWGLTALVECEPFGAYNSTLYWCSPSDIEILCNPPICMTFLMFFNDICQSSFEVFGRMKLPVLLLQRMQFSFEFITALVLHDPLEAMRAFDYVSGEYCISRLGFSSMLLKKLKQINNPELQRLLQRKFTQWQYEV